MRIEVEHEPLDIIKERVRGIPVCLISTPSPFLADERVFPFLGILNVAAQLRANGNPVQVLDLAGYKNFEEIMRTYLSGTDIRTFGLTATTPQIPSAVIIRNIIKEMLPDSRIILGGPHATLTHTGFIEDQKAGRSGRGSLAFNQLESLFDPIVVGDGEMAAFHAIDPLNKQRVIDAGILASPLFMKRGTLDQYSLPARDLIDFQSYRYFIDGKRAASVISQLGCPFECGFCGGRDSKVFRLIRSRSVQSTIGEIESIINMSREWKEPIEAIMFYDDELNVKPGVLEDLCKGLIALQERLGIEMRFRGFVKAELFTQEQADLMYKAGFRILLSGVESGSDKILKAMRKHTSREINSRCVEYAHNAGLRFKALMSIGHPGENEETVKESIDWCLANLKPGDDVDFTIITQFPGSPYFDHSTYIQEKDAWLYTIDGQNLWSKVVDYTKESDYYKGVPGAYTAFVWTDFLSPKDLVAQRDLAEATVRRTLNLPAISVAQALLFNPEHSMGMGGGGLPQNVLYDPKNQPLLSENG